MISEPKDPQTTLELIPFCSLLNNLYNLPNQFSLPSSKSYCYQGRVSLSPSPYRSLSHPAQQYPSNLDLFKEEIFINNDITQTNSNSDAPPTRIWKDFTNHKKYFDWLSHKLGLSTLDDWYGVQLKQIKEFGGRSLLNDYYQGNLLHFNYK